MKKNKSSSIFCNLRNVSGMIVVSFEEKSRLNILESHAWALVGSLALGCKDATGNAKSESCSEQRKPLYGGHTVEQTTFQFIKSCYMQR